jgi:hypothetical protein
LEHAHGRGDRDRRLPGQPFAGPALPDHPLAGLSARQKGGFYHDSRFAELRAVVAHYNEAFALNLTEQQKVSLIEYLRSL